MAKITKNSEKDALIFKKPYKFDKISSNLLYNRKFYDIIISVAEEKAMFIYGEVLKWGRLRALPVAEQASNKEWQRSKFGEANSEQQILGTATGSKRRRRLGDFPARCFSDNLIFFMEKYSSGRRGVTRNLVGR